MEGLFTNLGYGGSNPIADGYLKFNQSGSKTLLQIDSDGGANGFVTLATLNNMTAANLIIGTNVFV